MEGDKGWFLSRGVWGGVAAMIGGLGMLFGLDIDQAGLTDALVVVAATVGGLVAVVGRVLATKQIK